jgi:hypothetical protein
MRGAGAACNRPSDRACGGGRLGPQGCDARLRPKARSSRRGSASLSVVARYFADPWGNQLVLLDLSKSRYVTDDAGHVVDRLLP